MTGAHGQDRTVATACPHALPGPLARRAWQALALTCVGLGSAGVVLPLVPTTPFLLLAAWAASRSSPRLYVWLHEHPRYGPLLRDWRDHRALRPRTKAVALTLIALSWLFMLASVDSVPARIAASIVILSVATFLATRPSGPSHQADA